MPNNDLIPTSEVSVILGRDVSTVLRDVRDGRIPFVLKLPGRTGAYLFDRAVIDNLAVRDGAA